MRIDCSIPTVRMDGCVCSEILLSCVTEVLRGAAFLSKESCQMFSNKQDLGREILGSHSAVPDNSGLLGCYMSLGACLRRFEGT
jgi:hypothetical protein